MSASERLAQEDAILREIRVTLSTFRTMGIATPRRKGAVYASSPITSGFRLYNEMKRLGITSVEEGKKAYTFQDSVMRPNLRDGVEFGFRYRHLATRAVGCSR